MEEKNYTIAEEFELPSKGLIYERPVKAQVKLRSMNMRDEMKRTGRTDRPNVQLADTVENCMIEKPAVHVADMHYGDYEYLLHKLRVVTYGEDYKMTDICTSCGQVQDISTNLDEEKVKSFNADEFNSLLTLRLPKSGKEIKLKYTTARIIDEIKIKSEDMRKNSKEPGLDYEKFIKVSEYIDLVDGVKLSYIEKENFVNNLLARDINAISNRIDKIKNYIGLESEITFKCNKCGAEVTTFFRYTGEFFNPTED